MRMLILKVFKSYYNYKKMYLRPCLLYIFILIVVTIHVYNYYYELCLDKCIIVLVPHEMVIIMPK